MLRKYSMYTAHVTAPLLISSSCTCVDGRSEQRDEGVQLMTVAPPPLSISSTEERRKKERQQERQKERIQRGKLKRNQKRKEEMMKEQKEEHKETKSERESREKRRR